MTDKNKSIPDGFERIEHHEYLDLYNEEKGIIISIHEIDEVRQELHSMYPWKVFVSQNQKTLYEGSFQTQSHAEDKVIELANQHA